ncbi:MAG TPA: FAD-dependent monooxygenase [Burkholderiales bacterium]|nr:FAD-dependent monooxygenase [Burkholderiales bacterium]
MTSPGHEVLVVGGGPVGAALALAVADGGRSVLLADAQDDSLGDDDPRSLALSFGSRLILERLDVWDETKPATPIETIHVSHRGAFGSAVLNAHDAGVPALGYVVPYATVKRALRISLERTSNVTLLPGVRATEVHASSDSVCVRFEGGGQQRAERGDILAIADGGTAAAQTRTVRDYGQSAVVANVLASTPHHGRAFERFTSTGPLALLPREHGYALVWTTAPERATELCSLANGAFLERLTHVFGGRAGDFTAVDDRVAFPLSLRVAQRPATERTVLLGNAAQTLHPVAGQGLNLGLRDAWELAECIQADGGDPGRSEVLAAFSARRGRDRASSIALTDSLVRLFSSERLPLRWLRGCGLTFLDCLPPVKHAFMRQMMFGRPF